MQIDLRSDFTLDELLDALKWQEKEESADFHTRREWQEILGASGNKVTNLLRLALKKDMLLRAKHRREGLDGVWRPTQVYAFNVGKVSEAET